MKKDTINKILDIAVSFILIVLLTLLFFTCASCKIMRNLKQSSKDSVSVNSSSQGSVRVDSSGSKSDKTYTRETFYLPGKDTTINNYIFQPGESKSPVVYIRETGREQTEQAQIIKDTSWKDAFNSLAVLISNKETQTKTKIGPSLIEWILIGAVALLFLSKFITIKK